jgi:multiple sugar transport system permease protein
MTGDANLKRRISVVTRTLATTARTATRSPMKRRAMMGYVYISPWILGFIIFSAFPLLASFYLSFTQYDIISTPRFTGVNNYTYALFKDSLFWPTLMRTAYYALLNVSLGLTGSFIAALLLNQGLFGTVAWRTMYYLPSLTPIVASALLWSWILNSDIGILNHLLREWFGIRGPGWLRSIQWAVPGLIIMALWGGIGGSRMIVFLAGLQGVPQELYDASHVDGANAWCRFRHVTVPMMSPVIFFNMVLMIIGSFSVFTVSYIATGGGPAYATYFYVYHLYQNAFYYASMGYASALAYLFFVLILILTLIQFRASGRWVFYGGEVG